MKLYPTVDDSSGAPWAGWVGSPFAHAFTLPEVVIATGLLAFALPLMLSLMTSSLKTTNVTTNSLEATLLMESIEMDMRSNPKPGTTTAVYGLGPLPKSGDAAMTKDLYFARCRETVAADSPLRLIRVSVRLEAPKERRGLNVNLRSTWPAIAPVVKAEESKELVTYIQFKPS